MVIEDVWDQFDRDDLAGALILSLNNLAKGSLTSKVKNVIFGFDIAPDTR
jgi:hypothetical protein